jgi:ribonuclease HI
MYAIRFTDSDGRLVKSWPEAQALSQGAPGAAVRKFATRAEAEHWLRPAAVRVFYTDGSCVGARNARSAGWAVVEAVDRAPASSRSGRVPGAQTNNRAELCAILEALKLAAGQRCIIRTDSRYAIDCLTKFMPAWQRNGWRTVKGEPVKNQDLLQDLDLARKAVAEVQLQHVAGHSGCPLNDAADRLAVSAARNQGRVTLVVAA